MLTPERVQEIQNRHRRSHNDCDEMQPQESCDWCDLLRHIDTLTARVTRMEAALRITEHEAIQFLHKYHYDRGRELSAYPIIELELGILLEELRRRAGLDTATLEWTR